MANDVNIIKYTPSDGVIIGSTSALVMLPFIFHAPPSSSASSAPLVPSWMDGRLLLLLLFIIWIPSSVPLSLRTTLDCAVYLTIYKNIRWHVHDLWVDTRGLVCMGRWQWIPPFLLQWVPYWMEGRLLLLLLFIIWIPSSVALSLRTTLDRAVYLTIYKNIRWRVHDLWVDTRGLVYMGSWRWLPPFLLKGMSYLRVVCLGKEISLSDCFGAVVPRSWT